MGDTGPFADRGETRFDLASGARAKYASYLGLLLLQGTVPGTSFGKLNETESLTGRR